MQGVLNLNANYVRQMDVVHRISAEAGQFSHMSNREEVLRLRDEAIQAAADRKRCDQEIASLENELEELVAKHRRDAAQIQGRLRAPGVDADDRAKLRDNLQQLNTGLQRACDSINEKIAAVTAQRDDFFVIENRQFGLKQSLERLADPKTTMELAAADRWHSNLVATQKALTKRVAELRAELDIGKDTPRGWADRGSQETRMSAGDIAALEQAIEVAERVASWAGKCRAEVAAEVSRLKSEIES